MTLSFGSVCSGIEAASVAWHPFGWRAAWLAEIEPFPCAVLAHHYPDVENVGDMTLIPDRIALGVLEAPDVFCGGTPCQAFSVAGLRRSLDDARGNLSLTFCEIANAIDDQRRADGKPACIVFWENVPGVLTTKDNAFGCFLAGLAGESDPLQPPGGKWSDAGAVFGPSRAVAWRTLDAQYFGLAQRRRRVFVVASARDDFDPAAVLFEFDGVRRDTAPSREAGQATAQCLTTGTGKRYDPETETILPHGGLGVAHSLRGEGFDASEDGTGRGTPLVPVETKDVRYAYYSHDYANDRITDVSGINPALTARDTASGNLNVAVPVAYGIRTANTSSNGWGIQEECTHTPDCAQGVAVAVCIKGAAIGRKTEAGPPLVPVEPIAFSHICQAAQLPTAGGRDTSVHNPMTCGQVPAVAFPWQSTFGGATDDGLSGTLIKNQTMAVGTGAQVRRLTPVECERLQGFPDDYTLIPYRKKPAADGPRYKALGNSWAVPVVRWIGQRIVNHLAALA